MNFTSDNFLPKMRPRYFIMHASMLVLVLSIVVEGSAQSNSFSERFKKAYACNDCPDSVQLTLYNEALELGVKDIDDLANFHNALVNRGQLLAKAGNYNKAIEDFELALAVQPDDKTVYGKLGLAYLEMGKFDKAIKTYNLYIDNLEAERKTWEENPVMEDDDIDVAETIIQELKKRLAPLYNNRGIAYGHSGNHSEACRNFEKAYLYGMLELRAFIDEHCR